MTSLVAVAVWINEVDGRKLESDQGALAIEQMTVVWKEAALRRARTARFEHLMEMDKLYLVMGVVSMDVVVVVMRRRGFQSEEGSKD